MNPGSIMLLAWFAFNVYIITGASAYHSILVADEAGVHILDPVIQKNKTVLPVFEGVKSVGYNLQTGFIYGIVHTNVPAVNRIVRTKVVDTSGTFSCSKVESWCHNNRYCLKVCNSSNPSSPEEVLKPKNCFKANNLVLDWINSNMYWTCDPSATPARGATLNRATMEGSNSITILNRKIPFQSIDIDPFMGRLFYLESKPSTLKSTTLDGDNTVDNYYQFDEVALKVSVDTQGKTVYVVGHSFGNDEETILTSLNYNLTEFKKLYKSKDPAWKYGPNIVNSVLYWLTSSSNTEWEAVTEEKLKMKSVFGPYEKLNQWSLVHLEGQKPRDGSICSKLGCSHNCSLSHWMKIICQCPPSMVLQADNKSCYVPVTEAGLEPSMPKHNGTNLGINMKDKSVQDNEEIKRSNDTESTDLSTSISATTSNGIGDSKLAMKIPGESPVNGTDLAKSAVETSRNATEAVGAVTASSSNMALFYVVVTTICVSVFVVVVVVKRRAKTGNYQPADSGERRDFSL